MPFNVQPDLDGDTIVLVGPGATNDLSEVMFFAFSLDEANATISNQNGAGNATVTTGDSTTVTTSGTGQANLTTEGLGSSFLGDTNEGAL